MTNKKQLKDKIFQVRPLKPKEKRKSIDYWEGWTAARTEVYKILKKYDGKP